MYKDPKNNTNVWNKTIPILENVTPNACWEQISGDFPWHDFLSLESYLNRTAAPFWTTLNFKGVSTSAVFT